MNNYSLLIWKYLRFDAPLPVYASITISSGYVDIAVACSVFTFDAIDIEFCFIVFRVSFPENNV